MQSDLLRDWLEAPEQAQPALSALGVRDPECGARNLTAILGHLGPETMRELVGPIARFLPRSPDPDRALNNFERFLANPAGRALASVLIEARARPLEKLLQMLGTSQFFSDLLATHPEYLDMLRVPLRRSPSATELRQQLQAEVDAAFEDSAVLQAFRRFRHRQLLRIGTNDIIRDRPLEEITRDISRVADVALEVALTTALRVVSQRFGEPTTNADTPTRCVVLAFGKLGGEELNYSSDIDLMFVYDAEGQTRGRRVTAIGNDDFYARVVGEVVRLLSAHTDRGPAYRVDLRLRPEGHRGPLARSLASTLAYYDALGRTWERQALIKLRPVAGDLAFGAEFLRAVEPFVYRKYLSYAEIHEIKSLKHRIEQKVQQAGATDTEVKTGRGGIRDIEFTIQFLQLLNGGDLPEVRQRNTLLAMQALERVGCLTDQEYRLLDDAYRFLRKTEHRLQLLFDLQSHTLPRSDEELTTLARRLGYGNSGRSLSADGRTKKKRKVASVGVAPGGSKKDNPRDLFLRDYREKTDLNRKVLDHLLQQAFAGEDGQDEPVTDLILDPNPEPADIDAVLGRYRFRDPHAAFQNLMQLAQESVPFLSARRCRHFFSSIAPRLLSALTDTPEPDMALVNLEKVTASLGAKAVLWELFSFNPPSLKLYVDLCAGSQFLSEILINNPGMIDELLDSLVLNRPKTREELTTELAGLCRGASDPEPILHSFQDAELLRLGVRDILGKDGIRDTTSALSDLAEVILVQITTLQEPTLAKRFGLPILSEGPRAGQPSRYGLLGLGKLGGRELSYHSDLDLILVYEGDGQTGPPRGATRFDKFEATTNLHYFTELAQRVIKAMSSLGPLGRLYQVDMRLRPTGKSGSLAVSLAEFRRYYEGGEGQLWERQALTRARVVHGDAEFATQALAAARAAAYGPDWRPEWADAIRDMRERLESGRDRDLKRGFGGIVDIEFLVQLFQLKFARDRLALAVTNTWEALEALRDAGLLNGEEYTDLRSGYDFLRLAESRLRVMHNRSLSELPASAKDRDRLARRLGYDAGDTGRFVADLERHTARVRDLFLRLMERERN
jgi:glutamate-ammonia-ligase adenylyltransferase